MCDTLIKKNLPKEEIPQYVYKRVQKVGEGKYVTAVMGEPLCLNVWKKAPNRSGKKEEYEGGWKLPLVPLIKRKYKLDSWGSSSPYEDHHDGVWASFKHESEARNASMVSNFVDNEEGKFFPTFIVECEVKGIVHSAKYSSSETYLSQYLKVVREVRYLK